MRNKFWVSRKPRTAVTAAALAALMIGGTGLALAGSDSAQSSTAQSSTVQSSTALSAAAAQSPAAVVPLSGFADIVDSVRPAVVNIEAVREAGWRPDANEDETDPFDDFFERFSDEQRV